MTTGQVDIEVQHIFRRILRKMIVYGKHVDLHFSGSQAAALDLLQNHGPTKVTHLAESLSLSLSSVTLMSDKLIQHGFVTRERDDEDRRVVFLNITEQGKEALRLVMEQETKLLSAWISGIEHEDLELFNKTFQCIISNVNAENLRRAQEACDRKNNAG